MFRRKELLYIVLVQAVITLILSSATPNRGIVHPGADKHSSGGLYLQNPNQQRGF